MSTGPDDTVQAEALDDDATVTGLPQCIYFYHLSLDPEDATHPRVRAYFHDEKATITPAAAGALAKALLIEARSGALNPVGYGVGDLRWRRVSYLIFVADDTLGDIDGVGLPERHVSFGPKFRIRDLDQAFGVAYWNKVLPGPEAHEMEGGRWAEPFRIHAHPGGSKSLFEHEDTGTNMGPPVPPP